MARALERQACAQWYPAHHSYLHRWGVVARIKLSRLCCELKVVSAVQYKYLPDSMPNKLAGDYGWMHTALSACIWYQHGGVISTVRWVFATRVQAYCWPTSADQPCAFFACCAVNEATPTAAAAGILPAARTFTQTTPLSATSAASASALAGNAQAASSAKTTVTSGLSRRLNQVDYSMIADVPDVRVGESSRRFRPCRPVQCFANPCATVRCAAGTVCVANYCGGCSASCRPSGRP